MAIDIGFRGIGIKNIVALSTGPWITRVYPDFSRVERALARSHISRVLSRL